MSPSEQRIKLAEFMGWTLVANSFFKILRKPGEVETGYCMGLHLSDEACWWAGLSGDENGDYIFPDYPNDLNAVLSAEEKLSDEQWESYSNQLLWSLGTRSISASAAQRCEALIQTLGL
jgi:hypothetical protein